MGLSKASGAPLGFLGGAMGTVGQFTERQYRRRSSFAGEIRSLVWDMLRCRWLCADAKEIAADRFWSPEEIYLLESKSYKYVNGV